MQLNPRENFPIVRQLADPSDVNVYYVRAQIYDGKTGTLLDSVPLASLGSQLYSSLWNAPDDPTGLGRWIHVNTQVFFDAAFTQASPSYEIENTVYLVQSRVDNSSFGGPGYDYEGVDRLNRKAVREILAEMLDAKLGKLGKLLKPAPQEPGLSISDIEAAAGRKITEALGALNLAPMVREEVGGIVSSAIANLRNEILGVHREVTAKSANHVSAEVSSLRTDVMNVIRASETSLASRIGQGAATSKKEYDDFAEKLTSSIADLVLSSLGKMQLHLNYQPPAQKKVEQKSPIDFEKVKGLFRGGMSHDDIASQFNTGQ